MLGHRILRANVIAKRRFKHWYSDFDEKDPSWLRSKQHLMGALRKTNTTCSCEMCRNPRRCSFTKVKERPTAQERRAPTVESYLE